jgi:small subunit ribosomal protein S8
MLDPISDMLTRIRNAQKVGHATVSMPLSKLKVAIAATLQTEGFVGDTSIEDVDEVKKNMRIQLRYITEGRSQKVGAITQINRLSKEGQRRYVRAKDIIPVKNGYGISIISTSQGVMTGKDAFKKKLGGELICELW